ncbi:MAG: iron-containing alcohol dehydrogenase [Opitutaceae bacterium]
MNPIILQQPRRILFGSDTFKQTPAEVDLVGGRRVFVVTTGFLLEQARSLVADLRAQDIAAEIFSGIEIEPDIGLFKQVLEAGRTFDFDTVVGLGGGSVLDVAKLVAAFRTGSAAVEEAFGIGLLKGRSAGLICIPTTSGTGSEVSPNAILLDPSDRLKKGVVSPFLVPDTAIIDPLLTVSVPPAITAATGLDAMVHCMEAYANLHAHPTVDLYALEGIRRIAPNLLRAVKDGQDLEARGSLSLGSLYGGLCLGPVNTAAVHALSYPLGGEFHVPHGVSNTLLLPHVFRFNLEAAPDRYATIARTLGVTDQGSDHATASAGIDRLVELSVACGLPQHLREVGVKESDLPHLADESMKVTRLLKNNPRPMTRDDAESIFRAAW